MSARRTRGSAWLAGARDHDDVVGGRALRERPAVRWFDDDESEVRTTPSRPRRDGWNRHVADRHEAAVRTGRGR